MARTAKNYDLSRADSWTLHDLFQQRTKDGKLDDQGYSPMGKLARSLNPENAKAGLAQGLDPNEASIGYYAGRAGIVAKTPLQFAFEAGEYHGLIEPSPRADVKPGRYFDTAIALIEGGAKVDHKTIETALNWSRALKAKAADDETASKHLDNLTALVVSAIEKGYDPNTRFRISRNGVGVEVPLTKLPSEHYPAAIREAARTAARTWASTGPDAPGLDAESFS